MKNVYKGEIPMWEITLGFQGRESRNIVLTSVCWIFVCQMLCSDKFVVYVLAYGES